MRIRIASLTTILALLAPTPAWAWTCDTEYSPSQFTMWTRYCASSFLPPQGRFDYRPANLGQSRSADAAWCEGVSGDGLGETFALFFDEARPIRTLIFYGGHQRTATTFSNNGRPRDVEVTIRDGSTFVYRLDDSRGEQLLRLPRWVETDAIYVRINSVYPGARYSDTCVSGFWADLEEAG